MQLLSRTGGIAATNCFLIADEAAKAAVLFDAPDHTVEPLMLEAKKRGWDVVGLWLTHGHFDHLADHPVVTRHFPEANVLCHEHEAHKLRQPNTRLFLLPFVIPGREPDDVLRDGQTLRIGGMEVQVIHTPGHSPGHVVYHFPREKLVVGGDLIIGDSVGRTDLPDSSWDDLAASVRRVMKLPPDTTLLPGHGEPSTLADELRENPYVREAMEAS